MTYQATMIRCTAVIPNETTPQSTYTPVTETPTTQHVKASLLESLAHMMRSHIEPHSTLTDMRIGIDICPNQFERDELMQWIPATFPDTTVVYAINDLDAQETYEHPVIVVHATHTYDERNVTYTYTVTHEAKTDALLHYLSNLDVLDMDTNYVLVQNTQAVEHTLVHIFDVDLDTWRYYRVNEHDDLYAMCDTVDVFRFVTDHHYAYYENGEFVRLPATTHQQALNDEHDTMVYAYNLNGKSVIALVSREQPTRTLVLDDNQLWKAALNL